jgi:NAD(P)-dependent dehydrogenase (short-subunit alcohol dehydrogenase family)
MARPIHSSNTHVAIPDLRQDGRVAVVTGSRRGLGQAMALAFAEAGADVVVSDVVVDDGELEATAQRIRALGRRALVVKADVSSQADVDALMRGTVDAFGRIDILVNNAGILGGASLLTATSEVWDKVTGVHLKGTVLCSQAASKVMMGQRRGVIINLSSIAALGVVAGLYNMCKSTIITITYGLAASLGRHGIRVNAIAPGIIRTEMTRVQWEDAENLQRIDARTPLGRIGEPTDIALAALFLASDAARFVTGQTLTVDGGFHNIR